MTKLFTIIALFSLCLSRVWAFDIPDRTWVSRSYTISNAPGVGGAKHLRLMQNPLNGRIYFDGGDIAGSFQANTQAFFSLDITTNEWLEEYPSCGVKGDVIPGGPDEIGFVFDTKRNIFWSMPGFFFLNQSGPAACGFTDTWATSSPKTFPGVADYPNGGFYFLFDSNGNRFVQGVDYQVTPNLSANTTTLTNLGTLPSSVTYHFARAGTAYGTGLTLIFDPVKKKWADPATIGQGNIRNQPWPGQSPKNAVYDPVTDSIYRVGDTGDGIRLFVYSIATTSWSVYGLGCAIPDPGSYGSQGSCPDGQFYINDIGLGFEYLACDTAKRKCYIVDPYKARFLMIDMDTHQTYIKADPPFYAGFKEAVRANYGNGSGFHDTANLVFDTVNNVVLYHFLPNGLDANNPQMQIYNPDTNKWEIDAMIQPDGIPIRGNSPAFDAINNVFIVFGGLRGGDLDPTVNNYFLWRYKPGAPSTAPSAPSGMKVSPSL